MSTSYKSKAVRFMNPIKDMISPVKHQSVELEAMPRREPFEQLDDFPESSQNLVRSIGPTTDSVGLATARPINHSAGPSTRLVTPQPGASSSSQAPRPSILKNGYNLSGATLHLETSNGSQHESPRGRKDSSSRLPWASDGAQPMSPSGAQVKPPLFGLQDPESAIEDEPRGRPSISIPAMWASSPEDIRRCILDAFETRSLQIQERREQYQDHEAEAVACSNTVCVAISVLIFAIASGMIVLIVILIPFFETDCFAGDTWCLSAPNTTDASTIAALTTTSYTGLPTSHYVTAIPTIETIRKTVTEEIISIFSTDASVTLVTTLAPMLTATVRTAAAAAATITSVGT